MKKQILIVCFANYCRSPVAEYLLRAKYSDKFIVTSAGIAPKVVGKMDPRSQNYLSEIGIDNISHFPKKISLDLASNSDYIFALDTFILLELNKRFTAYKNKIKMLNFNSPSISLEDPYRMNDDDYRELMKNISKVVDSVELV